MQSGVTDNSHIIAACLAIRPTVHCGALCVAFLQLFKSGTHTHKETRIFAVRNSFDVMINVPLTADSPEARDEEHKCHWTYSLFCLTNKANGFLCQMPLSTYNTINSHLFHLISPPSPHHFLPPPVAAWPRLRLWPQHWRMASVKVITEGDKLTLWSLAAGGLSTQDFTQC